LSTKRKKEIDVTQTKVNKEALIQRMVQGGLLPVFRTDDVCNLFPATKALYDAGIGCIEYTMTMPNCLQLVKEASACMPKDLYLGLGTVMDGKTVDLAVEAGASFIASPGVSPDVIEACNRHGVVCVAGTMTPTEIMEAVRLGADVIKVFPAGAVTPEFFSDVLGPFPGLHLMAAAKSAMQNLKEYIAAGAEIITFLGNGLDAVAYASGDNATITRTAAKWVEAVQAARRSK
jgi:2-dehydro-3-deoxyphosphogluconate aldolase / (4S)-4-hydroxy-2-oxoglutarate aldolase